VNVRFYDGARFHDAVALGNITDHRVLEHAGQRANPIFHLRLLVFSGVVPAVLFQVALFARDLDALGNFGATAGGELFKLESESVVGLLGQPHRV
jgi:hypothetical protein